MALATTMEQVRRAVNSVIGRGRPVTPETTMAEIGDNLDRIDVVMTLEEVFGVEILGNDFTQETTLMQLADLCEQKAGSRTDGEVNF